MGKIIKVNNKMQKGYSYELTEPIGKNYPPDFKPELTPIEMIQMGVFGGKYFNDVATSGEYPSSWFQGAKLSGIDKPANPDLNYYGVLAGSSLKEWKENGWINEQDKRGFWEWYWRMYYGRRSPDDARQIARWKNAARFIKSAETYFKKNGKHSLVLLQTALQWGYDPRRLLKKSDIPKKSKSSIKNW